MFVFNESKYESVFRNSVEQVLVANGNILF